MSSTTELDENINNVLVGFAMECMHEVYDSHNLDKKLTGSEPERIVFSQAKSQIKHLIIKENIKILEELSLEIIQPCKENCTDVEHAFHQGTWKSHVKVENRINELQKELGDEE